MGRDMGMDMGMGMEKGMGMGMGRGMGRGTGRGMGLEQDKGMDMWLVERVSGTALAGIDRGVELQ